jgi:hypothetical protein
MDGITGAALAGLLAGVAVAAERFGAALRD